MQHSIRTILALTLTACLGSAAQAQTYPSKPVKIVSGNAGGASDIMARIFALGITQQLGQPAVVVNHSGAQVIAVMDMVRAAPDGYTLLSVGANQLWLAPFVQDDVPYDPLKDMTPVSITASSPNMIVVHTSVPAKNVKELIALAKAKPGVLHGGIANLGGAPTLAFHLFKSMTGTDMVGVPYKGTPQAMNAVLAGEVEVLFPTVSTGMPGVKSGKLRALGVTTDRPSSLAPGMPTVADAGVPGYESSTTFAVFAPAKTPAAIVNTLQQMAVKYLQAPEIKEKLAGAGLEVWASTPQEMANYMRKDMERMSKIIKDARLRGES